jgi:ABC-2 type transport system permease protein
VANPYAVLLRTHVRARAQYRFSFWIDMAFNVASLGADLLSLLVMFAVADNLGGFTRPQVLVMFGFAGVGFTLADLAVGNIEKLRGYVRTGMLDTVLIRPLGVLGQLLAMDFGVRRIGRLLYSMAILGVALGLAGPHWTVAKAAMLMLAPIAGAALFGSIFVATSVVAFWWIESGELGNIVTYGGRDFTSYPTAIFTGWFRRIFGFLLGMGFIAYYPALFVLDLPDPIGLPRWAGWLSLLIAPVAVAAATLVWQVGVRHYRSTGS